MKLEIWKSINESKLYEISNIARIRSYRCNSGGQREYPNILTPQMNMQGYYHVGLVLGGQKTTRRRGRLVAQAFVDNPDNKKYVNHIDGNKTNDLPYNLEWVTASENIVHAYANGLMKNGGMNAPYRKLTESQIVAIRNGYKLGNYTQSKLAKMYNVDQSTISNIINFKTWSQS